MRTTAITRTARERLHARRRELLEHHRSMVELAEEEPGREPELVDMANEQWDQRVLSLMSTADLHGLESVHKALDRLDAGRYGVCVHCKGPIEPERLRILPETEQCFDCAELAEERTPRWVMELVH